MIVLGGIGSFFIGASLQTSMPAFAHYLGTGSAGTTYGLLLFAGGVIGSVLLALIMLVIGGMANLASMPIGQTIVQLLAPPADRGRVMGLYGVSSSGLRAPAAGQQEQLPVTR